MTLHTPVVGSHDILSAVPSPCAKQLSFFKSFHSIDLVSFAVL